jgi:TPP-dependent pyruvate/acetoin dehydrogenase alpha subunit
MLRIRQFEGRCAELYGAGKIRGFLHLYDGEEAIAVGVMQVLGSGDSIVSTYREHGHAIARGIGLGPLMAELYGKRDGCSGGRGGSSVPASDPDRASAQKTAATERKPDPVAA